MPDPIAPCRCWTSSPPIPHFGHCCFHGGALDDYQPGQPTPCGHNEPEGTDA